jgi:hypothetical protein
MPTTTGRLEIYIETAGHKTKADTACSKADDGTSLLGSLIALAGGIAFGFVLAICFLGGRSEGATSVTTLAQTLLAPGAFIYTCRLAMLF